MKIVAVKIFLCIALITLFAGTTIITMPNYDLVNHDMATQDSVKSTIDEDTPSKVTTKTSTIILTTTTTTKPTSKTLNETSQNIQSTTIDVTESNTTKDMECVINPTNCVEQVIEESEYKQSGETKNNNNSHDEKSEEDIEEYKYENTYYDILLDIDNPDPDYNPAKIELSSAEREEIACIVMGEFGGGGYTGCALLAQCIRDAMDKYGYSGLEVKSHMNYYGYNPNPSSTAYEAVDWIFDGNAAVQHRILVMNNSDGGWHSTQNFVVYYQGVWFYDLW